MELVVSKKKFPSNDKFESSYPPQFHSDPSIVAMDEQVFARPICQRVYQYLRRHMGNYNLDSFSYIGNVEGNKKNCLEIFLQ